VFFFSPGLFAVKGALQSATVACPIIVPTLDATHGFRMKYFRFECLYVHKTLFNMALQITNLHVLLCKPCNKSSRTILFSSGASVPIRKWLLFTPSTATSIRSPVGNSLQIGALPSKVSLLTTNVAQIVSDARYNLMTASATGHRRPADICCRRFSNAI
jgi:hypothetical protein